MTTFEGLVGSALRWAGSLSAEEIKRIGAKTGGRTLFFGGLLFGIAGVSDLLDLQRYLPIDAGMILIVLFMLGVAVPAFVYSWKEVQAAKREHHQPSQQQK